MGKEAKNMRRIAWVSALVAMLLLPGIAHARVTKLTITVPAATTHLYEFTYPAKDPKVAGLGFAMLRDIATFLRDATQDDHETANPLAGVIDFMYSTCSSQPCRTMRDFVYLGFNEADSGPVYTGHGHGGGLAKKARHRPAFHRGLHRKGGGRGLFPHPLFSPPAPT